MRTKLVPDPHDARELDSVEARLELDLMATKLARRALRNPTFGSSRGWWRNVIHTDDDSPKAY